MQSKLESLERLLVLLSYSDHEKAEIDECRSLASAVTSWGELWDLSRVNATAPLVTFNLKKLGLLDKVPRDVASRFEEASEKIKVANEARLKVARELFAEFSAKGIPVVILKGILFAETIYKNPHYKKMNDVDILVRREDLDAIYDIYGRMGFFSAAELVGGSPRKQEKFSHHAPPFFSRDLKCMIGTHWGLITPLAPYKLDYSAIWSRVRDIDFYGHPAKSMAPEDNLHHLCVHLPYYKTGVRELADIYNLVRRCRKELDWPLFLSEVAKAGTENLVYHALSLSDRLSPDPDVKKAVAAVEPRTSAYFREETARKTERLGRLVRSRSVHMSRIEKAYGDLNTTKKPKEKWQAFGRMWGNMLLPPKEDVLKMNALDSAEGVELFKARLMTPWRIYKVFARDVGGKIFAAIMAKSAYEVVRDTVRAPLGKGRQVQDYEAFARKLGVTVKDLENLKEGLE
ncbi:MAG: nucleotidyltransferase family protein [Deltaproteobacteria bacterium]|nr:nucleotidyltransferase family protein [Deltaproteobacteria bacterium]